MGIDVAGSSDDKGLFGVWDTPTVALPEIAKILWHSFKKRFVAPRRYYFIAPKDCGMKLKKLFKTPGALKGHLVQNWDKLCAEAITLKEQIELTGAFKDYVDNFAFSIFAGKAPLEIIDEHRNTPYHVIRFGGGLPNRPKAVPPPADVDSNESRYVRQLFDAYGDRKKSEVKGIGYLDVWPDLRKHFDRQREYFYHAEALRNFARDTVPPGTFEELQSEIHAGVAEVETADHQDSLARCDAVTNTAAALQMTANPLLGAVKIQDRKGICHQLANDDVLQWRKP